MACFIVLPRHHGDGLLRVYPDEHPRAYGTADPTLDAIAARVRASLI